VPGPVTSSQSAGCHQVIRDWGGTLVTCAADIVEMLTPLGGRQEGAPAERPRQEGAPAVEREPGAQPDGVVRPAVPRSRDDLDLDSARVLDAFPARSAIGPSTIATRAGVELGTVIRCLGLLAGCGFIERCDQGWRLTRKAR